MALCVDDLRVTPEDIQSKLIWVAEREALLGCVTLLPDAEGLSGEVSAFFIHPSAKRQGQGRELWATNGTLTQLVANPDGGSESSMNTRSSVTTLPTMMLSVHVQYSR